MSGADTEALLGKDEAPLSLAEAHFAAAKVQARAINAFTFVLALGGLVVLLAILHESYAWRKTAWGIVQDAGISESKAWRDLVQGIVDKFPHWPIG